MRAILETVGIQDVVAKSIRSSNPYNMVRATFAALAKIESARDVATRRGIKISALGGRAGATQRRISTGSKLDGTL